MDERDSPTIGEELDIILLVLNKTFHIYTDFFNHTKVHRRIFVVCII